MIIYYVISVWKLAVDIAKTNRVLLHINYESIEKGMYLESRLETKMHQALTTKSIMLMTVDNLFVWGANSGWANRWL